MGIESIRNFITLPELPDIISYLILFTIMISEHFLKKFVQKDNKTTLFRVETRTKDLERAISEFEKEKKALEKERKQIRRELKLIKDAVKQEAKNSRELVSNGTANEIIKLLDNESEIGEEDKDGKR